MDALLELARAHGIDASEAVVLSDRSTRIVDLVGSGIVARVHKVFSGETADYGRSRLRNEKEAAMELLRHGARVNEPVADIDVLAIGDEWVSFWRKEDVVSGEITGAELAASVLDIERAFRVANVKAQPLTTWKLASSSADKARTSSDDRLMLLANKFDELDVRMRAVELFGSHGDAHPGNLMKTGRGCIWVDLEDVCLMPRYWDIATSVARTLLLGWNPEVSVGAMRSYVAGSGPMDWDAFMFAVSARCVQITLLCWEFVDELNEATEVEARIEGTLRVLSDPGWVHATLGIDSTQ